MKARSSIARKIVSATALGFAFLFLASVFVPDFGHAVPDDRIPAGSVDPAEGLPTLGSIEDDRHYVRIVATPNGPLYSVFDRADDSEIASLLTAEQAAEWFPELPIPDMDFGTDGSPLMMAEPAYLQFQ